MFLNLKGQLKSLEEPLVMGILNLTEDSFYDGGCYLTEKTIIERAKEILKDGADIIDIGAVSTRSGALERSEEEEITSIANAILLILKEFPEANISVDTWRASVARKALDLGAAMINDISGGTFDPKMLKVVAEARVPYCLQHCPAKPEVMQQYTHYNNLIGEMLFFLGKQIAQLKEMGINDIILDPGFGFGKDLDQNYFLLKNLNSFTTLHLPILVGVSRKSMIYKLLETNAQHALNGTSVLHAFALQNGASILRVHDVREAKECVKLFAKTFHSNY